MTHKPSVTQRAKELIETHGKKLAPIRDDWGALRDALDLRTDGELAPIALDQLTDIVQARLQRVI